MNTNSVRNFIPSDLDSLSQMIIDTIDHSYSQVYPERAVEFFKTYHSKEKILERNEKGEILIIEKDKEIIATGTVVENATGS